MTAVDPLAVITAAIPVSPDDGCTIVEVRPDGEVTWGHPATVAALVRDALERAGLLVQPASDRDAEEVTDRG